MNLILLVLAGIFVNNYVMSQFLGICPFLGVSKKVDTAAGMGGAVIFVITLSSFVTSLIYTRTGSSSKEEISYTTITYSVKGKKRITAVHQYGDINQLIKKIQSALLLILIKLKIMNIFMQVMENWLNASGK